VSGLAGPALKAAAAFADDIVKIAKEENWLTRLKFAFREKHHILIFGSTGTGKTNFLDSFTRGVPEAIRAEDRTMGLIRRRIRIENEPFVFIDTPGESRRPTVRTEAVQLARAKQVKVIFNIVAYGYHEYRTGRAEALRADRINEAWLEKHRKVEIEDLNRWLPQLDALLPNVPLVTLVTKADLWEDRRDDVIEYYEKGDYARVLRSSLRRDHSVMMYCAVLHKFYGQGRLSGSFDESDRLRTRVHLLHQLVLRVTDDPKFGGLD
jgi:DNA helicase HerA-like ATPase